MKISEKLQLKGEVKIITSKNGKVIRETSLQKNLIMFGTNTGKSLILQRLIGTNTYSLNITHADIGRDATAPTVNDIDLGDGILRAIIGLQNISGNQVTMSFFYPDGLLPNDTYREFGSFVDGTGTLGSGQIFNRIVFASPYIKSTGEDTTIRIRFTLT